MSGISKNYNKGNYNEKIFLLKVIFFIIKLKDIIQNTYLNKRRKLNDDDNKLEEKQEKIRMNNITRKYINTNFNIILIIIKSILITKLLGRTISIINEFVFFQNSKIALKVKGIGENVILNSNYQNKNYLKEVFINREKKNIVAYKYQFNQTENFVELIWNDYINNTENMFKDCTSITEINLSNFNTSYIISMESMFEGCSSLTSLDLSNFNTKLVKRMDFMFSKCYSLTSLDLSYFDTSSVTIMDSMFSHCLSLTTLNLSNFDISSLSSIDSMFYNCNNLEYINLYNFNESKLRQNIFANVPNNLIICMDNITNISIINSINDAYNFTNFINHYNLNHYSYYNSFYNAYYNTFYYNNIKDNCFTVDCSNDWKARQKKLISNNNKCIESCNDSKQYPYEYNGKCYAKCSKGYFYDNNNQTIKCKCELDQCLLCPQVALNKGLCTKCNDDYYPKENDSSNLGDYFNCYKEPEGYYLDKDIYRKCYETCKTCDKEGNYTNHNCIICNSNTRYAIKKNDILNCYSNCTYYYYYDENNYYCTMNLSCPDAYPKLKPNTKECTDNMFVEDIIEDISHITKNGIEVSKEQDIKYYNEVLKNIEKGFTSLKYDRSNIEKGQDEVIKTDKVTVILTTSENQKNNVNNNMTTIDIGECENLLRQLYHIPSDEKLYMKIMGIVQDGMNAIKVEYDIYCKLNGTNLIKLNLTVCKETTVTIRIPFEINDHIDKLNTSSGYYNDICYTTTSEDGTDISMKDRKNDFANQDRIVCQEGCIFSEYDYDNHVAKCKCNVKESPPSIADMKIDKEKLLANFKDIKSFANFNFLVCNKKLFTKEGIKNNYGCYLMSIIILFHILSIFIFILNNFHLIKKQIIDIASKINKNQSTSIKEVKKNSKLDDKEIFIFKAKKEKNKENINFDKKKLIKNTKTKINEVKKPSIKDSSKNRIINKSKINNNLIKNKPINNLKIQTKKLKDKINPINIINQKAKIGIKENFKNYIDEEINGLSYEIAVKFDKRNFCEYYESLIKTQHNLICALFNKSDYNSGIIKIDLFLVGFVIEYAINVLFYNDDTMHEIYESKGEFDIETQLPIIVYSNIISYILNSPLNFLALSNEPIINFKQSKDNKKIMKKAEKLLKILKIKFSFYFIISSLFLFFFWYYISMFGVIYRNTQIHFLKDITMSFRLSLSFPFFIYLMPGFLRLPGLSKKKKCLYNVSKFLKSF